MKILPDMRLLILSLTAVMNLAFSRDLMMVMFSQYPNSLSLMFQTATVS